MTSVLRRHGPPFLILLAVAISLHPLWIVSDTTRRLRAAARAYYFDDFPAAVHLANDVLRETPDNRQALLIAGEASARLQQSERAISYFDRIPEDGSPESVLALAGKGERLMMLRRVRAAERVLRKAVGQHPGHFGANKNLGFLLQVQGRTWESLPCIREQVRQGRFHGDELQILSVSEILYISNKHFVAECLAAVPDDPLPLLSRARYAQLRNNLEESEHLLRKILTADPGLLEAQARLGQILLDGNRMEEFVAWHRDLPPVADVHPEIWFARGVWASHAGQTRVAVRCFLESVARSFNHVRANYQLSLLLNEGGNRNLADRFSVRADRLAKLELEFVGLIDSPRADGLKRAATLLEQLGRFHEAAGIYDLALRILRDEPKWARPGVKRVSQQIDYQASFIVVAANPMRGIDLTQYPLPDVHTIKRSSRSPMTVSDVDVTFTDVARQVGLNFTYFNGSETPRGLNHIFETTGGGVASLDFNGDAWPDLYFSQGGDLPPQTDSFEHCDALFRNLGGDRFENVSALAGLGDHLFGQGVTVGDYNDDGFPDLYVANLGTNRLYTNNGDGTFQDVTNEAGCAGDAWTLSCVMADLNGDAFPDIYAVNYLTMQSVLDRLCRKNGHPQTCAPTLFPAEQDRLYLNLGDGHFSDVTDGAGITLPDGKGLGIIAADFDGSGRLSLFVGNDTATNFFFVNQTTHLGGDLSFAESGLLMGLGVGGKGRAQATMGIAADDANGDGLIDIFTTNFYADANSMYVHQPGQVFVDESRRTGLYDPGFNLLGFGAQFLDGELDGYPDLVVANGHVDRTEATGEPDEMPPQYFQNLGSGRYAEIVGPSLGRYFEGSYLGRALTRLDWNRDGLEDFCVGHLHAPVSLVTNETTGAGHYLVVRLRGTQSNRDAIGTTVLMSTIRRVRVMQLTAGDGYLSSNQRQLVFGLGGAERVDELTIRWPSGRSQVFHDLTADREILCVEGRSDFLDLTQGAP